jgi:hypothetical protein
MCSVCVVEVYVTVNNVHKILNVLLWFCGELMSPATTRVLRSSCTMSDFCPILTTFEVPRQIFIKIPGTIFHGNPSSGSRADTMWTGEQHGRTDGRTDWQTDNRGAEFFQKCRRRWHEASSIERTHKYQALPYKIGSPRQPVSPDLCTPVLMPRENL